MNKKPATIAGAFLLFAAGFIVSTAFAKQELVCYILEHEKDLATPQPGPHDGGDH